ncbi:hypothetical protein JGU66_03900 [Myxococcaceae bacterium JPH2]|nr:hypothetical protein [Myxococcaceae bacterium JPH2]
MNGRTIHVGWNTQDHSSSIKSMYWTAQTALANLTAANTALMSSMRLLSSSGFTLQRGGTLDVSIPESVPEGSWVILSYAVTGTNGSAESVDFVQAQALSQGVSAE